VAWILASRRVFVDPTLAVFEKQLYSREAENAVMVQATRNMIAYVGVLHKAGVPLVVGSHTSAPYAEARREHDLGSIEPGKLADLVALDAGPTIDIRNARRVTFIVVDGKVVERERLTSLPAIQVGAK
jgi:N-acetylglucosamine-6-phosphate deacetylase